MKKFLSVIVVATCVISCNNNSNEPEPKVDTIDNRISWVADFDSSGNLAMKQTDGGPDTLTAAAVISFMNTRYTNVQMHLVKQSRDTIYISIPEATYLTQQMGSSGPEIFFADAVYNLTEIAGVRYVNFQFEEGDHATPGVLNRNSFKEQ